MYGLTAQVHPITWRLMLIGFENYEIPKWLDYVETGDDTIHPIQHVGNVSFDEEGNWTYIKNILHVPTIMKNLVSVGQIVEQGMQVHFNHGGCFIEKEGHLISHGQREGQMFILNSHKMKWVIFTKGYITQKNRPYQSPKAQGHAVERSQSDSRLSKIRRLKAYVYPIT